jgi:hypothetical protein
MNSPPIDTSNTQQFVDESLKGWLLMWVVCILRDGVEKIIHTNTQFMCEQYIKIMYPTKTFCDSKGNEWKVVIRPLF